jgi:transposase
MLQLTPQSRILLATEPVDFRKGIDRLAALCRHVLTQNPLSGTVFVFRNRAGTARKDTCIHAPCPSKCDHESRGVRYYSRTGAIPR